MSFSASDAAFEGFRLARRRPLTVVALSVVSLISTFATYWVMDASGYMQAVAAVGSGASADPQAALGLLGPMFRFFLGCAVIGCIGSAIQAGAVYRGVLRPKDHGFLGLAFGGDELRLMGLAIIIVLLASVAFFVLMIVVGILIAIVGAAAGAGGGGGVGPALLMVALAYALIGVASMWLGTKMSFAGPDTFSRRQLSVFRSWGLTKDRFWGLLGCYFLAFFLALLIGFIMFVVALTVASVTTGTPFMTALGEFAGSKPGAVMDLYTPVRVIYTLVAALFGGLLNMVMTAPAAEAYRQICQPGEAQADTFS